MPALRASFGPSPKAGGEEDVSYIGFLLLLTKKCVFISTLKNTANDWLSEVTRNHVLTFVSALVACLHRYTNALRPAGHQAKGLCRLQPENQGPLPAEGLGQVLARRLPQVRLLRLPTRRGGLHTVHQSQPHPLSEGLPKVRGKTCSLCRNTHSTHHSLQVTRCHWKQLNLYHIQKRTL